MAAQLALKRCPTCDVPQPVNSARCACRYEFPMSAATATRPRSGISWLYQLCLALILLWTLFCLMGACYGMVNVASGPVPTNPYAKAGRGIGAAIGLSMWAVAWVVPVVGLGIIGLLVKPQ